MALINSNTETHFFKTSRYGEASITKNSEQVYTISTSSTTTSRQALVETINFEDVSVGDLVTIKTNVDGVGKFSFYLVELDESNEVVSKTEQRFDVEGKQRLEVTFVARASGRFKITLGCGWNTNYDGIVKDIQIGFNSISVKSDALSPLPSQRIYLQTTTNGGFVVRDDLSTNSGTLSIDGYTLLLNLDTPMPHRFTAFVGENFVYQSVNYKIRTDSDNPARVEIRFFNAVDNSPVQPTEIPSAVYFGLLLV